MCKMRNESSVPEPKAYLINGNENNSCIFEFERFGTFIAFHRRLTSTQELESFPSQFSHDNIYFVNKIRLAYKYEVQIIVEK